MSLPAKGLLALPAELRDEIYTLVLTPNTSAEPTNLYYATPPSKSLVLTCRQINAEAAQYHREAYRSYWRDTHFVIDRRFRNATEFDKQRIKNRKLEDIQNIHNLDIIAKTTHGRDASSQLLDVRGLWKSTVSTRPSYRQPTALTLETRVARGVETIPYNQERRVRSMLASPRFVSTSLLSQILEVLRLYERWETAR